MLASKKPASGLVAESTQYGRARGASGLTGASARDFANEQQGLGGLVKLYATVAANTYAAMVAFNALKSAMDTTTMVEGMNQLGARSGIALGALSQNMVKAAGGAISLREAMEATTKGTAAGLSSKQMMELTKVAKNASQALGVDMTDALSRLSRGITKLEPELLDELGLFTKIGPATDEYARKIGKAASQLTDFERRQAFANAVLKEGSDKFGDINLPANPYKELEASLKNLGQTFLEITNKFIVPFANLFANNSTLLTAAIVGIGAKLTGMALPALGDWQKGLVDSAAKAKAAAADINTLFSESLVSRVNKSSNVDALKQELELQEKITQKAREEFSQTSKRTRTTTYTAVTKQPDQALGDEQLKKAKQDLNRITREYIALDDIAKDPKRAQAITKAERDRMLLLEKEEVILSNLIKQEELRIKKVEQLKAAEQQSIETIEKTNIGATAREKLSEKAGSKATKLDILSQVSGKTQKEGIGAAVEAADAAVAAAGKSLGKVDGFVTKTLARIISFVTEAGILFEAFVSPIIGWVAGIGIAFAVLDPILSSNTKQAQAFTDALENADEVINSATRTIDYINKQPAIFSSTSAGIKATSNAITELKDSFNTLVDTAKESREKMNFYWDKPIDFIAGFIGQDASTKLAKKLTEETLKALELFKRVSTSDKAEIELKAKLGIDSLSKSSLEKLFKTESGQELGKEALEKLTANIGNASSKLEAFKTTSEGVTKAYEIFIQGTANTDPLFSLAKAIQLNAQTIMDFKTDGIDMATAAMIDLAKSPEKGIFFGENFTNKLLDIKEGFLEQVTAINSVERGIRDLDKAAESLNTEKLELKQQQKSSPGFNPQRSRRLGEIEGELEKNQSTKQKLQQNLELLPRDKVEQAKSIFTEGLKSAFAEGSRLIDQALGNASERAAITIGKATLGALSGEERAKKETGLNQQEIKIQMRAIDTNIQLILSQERLKASIDLSSAKTQALIVEQKKDSTQAERDAARSEVRIAQAVRDTLDNISQPKAKASEPKVSELKASESKVSELKASEPKDASKNKSTIVSAPEKVTITVTNEQREGGRLLVPAKTEVQQLSEDEKARADARTLAAQQRVAAQEANRIQLQGAFTAEGIRGNIAQAAGRVEDLSKQLKLDKDVLDTKQKIASIESSILGYTTQRTQQSINQTEQEIKSKERKIEDLDIENKISVAKGVSAKKEVEKLEKQQAAIKLRQQEDTILVGTNQSLKNITNKYFEQRELLNNNYKLQTAAFEKEQARINLNSNLLSFFSKRNMLDAEYLTNQESLNREKQNELDYTKTIAAANKEYSDVISGINEKLEKMATQFKAIGELNKIAFKDPDLDADRETAKFKRQANESNKRVVKKEPEPTVIQETKLQSQILQGKNAINATIEDSKSAQVELTQAQNATIAAVQKELIERKKVVAVAEKEQEFALTKAASNTQSITFETVQNTNLQEDTQQMQQQAQVSNSVLDAQKATALATRNSKLALAELTKAQKDILEPIEKELTKRERLAATEEATIALRERMISLQADQLALSIQGLNYLDKTTLAEKQRYDTLTLEVALNREQRKLSQEISNQEFAIQQAAKAKDKDLEASLIKRKQELLINKEIIDKNQLQEKYLLKIRQAQEEVTNRAAQENAKIEYRNTLGSIGLELESETLQFNRNKFKVLQDQGLVSQQQVRDFEKSQQFAETDLRYRTQIKSIQEEIAKKVKEETDTQEKRKIVLDPDRKKKALLEEQAALQTELNSIQDTLNSKTADPQAMLRLKEDKQRLEERLVTVIAVTDNLETQTNLTSQIETLNYSIAGLEGQELADAQAKLATLKSQLNTYREITGTKPDAAENAQSAERVKRFTTEGEARIRLAKRSKDSTDEITQSTYQYSARTEAYLGALERGFDSLGDAIANFVKTGKLDFKSLIDSMLMDILRWEVKQATLAMYQGVRSGGGGNLLSTLGSAFVSSFIGGPEATITGSSGTYGMNTYSRAAKGAAFDGYGNKFAAGGAFDEGYPVHEFAKGGMFTNSIVNQPTMFKFAKGIGLMGEAGPEAIMPLKRDQNGNLGVRAEPSGSNVNVIVNNHSGQQAQTRENVDSRGNRTIEVTVGDMVAQQLATKGSSVQQTLAATYGTKPAISRR
jgi:lambda family phage tail tape measure protein